KNQFEQQVETYQAIIEDCTNLNVSNSISNEELDLWYTRHTTLLPMEKSNVIDLYFNINPDVFLIISKLVKIFKTLPVSTATGQSSFSSLRSLKTYFRNSTSQNRLY
ncbi:52 kDa repressor of the inhibitor of the protein kinase-like, partial [Aphis craccivora]